MVQAVSEDADLVLTIELHDASVQWIGDPAAETIPKTVIGVLDQILNSLALTPQQPERLSSTRSPTSPGLGAVGDLYHFTAAPC